MAISKYCGGQEQRKLQFQYTLGINNKDNYNLNTLCETRILNMFVFSCSLNLG